MTTEAKWKPTGDWADELAELARCGPDCGWSARWISHRQVYSVRHGDGEAVSFVPPGLGEKVRIPPDIRRWLKTLHPK